MFVAGVFLFEFGLNPSIRTICRDGLTSGLDCGILGFTISEDDVDGFKPMNS